MTTTDDVANGPAEDEPERNQPPANAVSRRLLGYSFLGCAIVMLTLLSVFVYWVVPPLTRPSIVLDHVLEEYSGRLLREKQGDEATEQADTADRLTLDLVVTLEYASADIRLVGVQLAFGIMAGVFFALVGVLLLAAGFTGALDLTGSGAGTSVKLSTTAPGVVCILLGGLITCISVYKEIRFPISTAIERPIHGGVSTTVKPPPGPGIPEETPQDYKPEASSQPRPDSVDKQTAPAT